MRKNREAAIAGLRAVAEKNNTARERAVRTLKELMSGKKERKE